MSGLELMVAVAFLAPAQEPPPPAPTTVLSPAEPPSAPPVAPVYTGATLSINHSAPRPVDEQIEVMRALLLRKLSRGPSVAQSHAWAPGGGEGGMAPTPTPAPGMVPGFRYGASPFAGGPPLDSPSAPTIEGVYLSGHGVVFTVTMEPPARDPWAKADVAKAQPALTEWERTQRQMRGEPVPEKSASTKKEPPLGEVLVKLLAENGKHFTALKDDERVTLAVTFRGTAGPVPAWEFTANVNVPGAAGMPFAAQQPGGVAGGLERPTPFTHSSDSDFALPTDQGQTARDLELLGDMHLKQNQPRAAVDALERALKLVDADGSSHLWAKLAQAHAAAGKMDQALDALEHVKAMRQKATKPEAKSGNAPAKPATPLPARLTLSAPKKLLDQVAAGKVTLEMFREQATAEYVPAGK
jgi:hypothetical protein